MRSKSRQSMNFESYDDSFWPCEWIFMSTLSALATMLSLFTLYDCCSYPKCTIAISFLLAIIYQLIKMTMLSKILHVLISFLFAEWLLNSDRKKQKCHSQTKPKFKRQVKLMTTMTTNHIPAAIKINGNPFASYDTVGKTMAD